MGIRKHQGNFLKPSRLFVFVEWKLIGLQMCLQKRESSKKKKEDCQSEICLIKTEKLGEAIDAEDVEEADLFGSHNWFLKLDANYLKPFFTRKMASRSGSICGSKFSQDFDMDWYKYVNDPSAEESP
ncbi:hypothetical protein NPIL_631461 [Nephila pilipes]|uniref:Uncharacterized protein n=1 Tax=Nephila pilipes TaxID=299642 RepID=A0A8X6Q862_NEPPI|nr:hypothetical protein NPIL_631461 [Nephila pilipes]